MLYCTCASCSHDLDLLLTWRDPVNVSNIDLVELDLLRLCVHRHDGSDHSVVSSTFYEVRSRPSSVERTDFSSLPAQCSKGPS